MPEYVPCRACSTSSTPGLIITENNIAIDCPCKVEWDKVTAKIALMQRARLPESLYHYDISTYYKKKHSNSDKIFKRLDHVVDNISDYVDESANLYLWGLPNTQKTSAISHYIIKLLDKGVDTYYLTMTNLSDLLIKSKDFDASSSAAGQEDVKRLIKCQVLVIDDAFSTSRFYVNNKNNFKTAILDEFFSERSNSNSVNIYIANNSIATISKESFGPLTRFLNRNCLEFEFNDELEKKAMTSKILQDI
jgi:DNA replication protein DnaC